MEPATQALVSRSAVGVACALSLLVLAGCATSGTPPTEQMALARSAVDDAVSAGSAEYAPVALEDAQEMLDKARAAVADGHYDAARRYAEATETDARLAAITARSAKAQLAVREVESGLRALREEIARNHAR